MKKLLILLILLSSASYGADCAKHPIFCQITQNSPKINQKYAMKLSDIIYKMHRKYHIPSRIFTAILMQESHYTLKTNGCHKGLILPKCDELKGPESIRAKCRMKPNEFVEEVKVCSDFGIAQIYYRTARKLDMDISKLTTDLEYSVEAGAIVLAGFMKRYEAKDNDWWVRYNCSTRSTTKRDTCQIYKKLVNRYL